VRKSKNKKEERDHEKEWEIAVAQAVNIESAKTGGNVSIAVKSIIDLKKKESELNWTILLRNFIEMSALNDYSYLVPSRKYYSEEFIMPSLKSPVMKNIVIAIDTSGSISNEYLMNFFAEISSIIEDVNAIDTIVIQCDDKIRSVNTYNIEDLPIKESVYGRGLTAFKPVFDYINDNDINPSCLIYLTDLYGNLNLDDVDYPVLWVLDNINDYQYKHFLKKIPFGDILSINNI